MPRVTGVCVSVLALPLNERVLHHTLLYYFSVKRLSSMSRVYIRFPAGSRSGVMIPSASQRRNVWRDLPMYSDASVMLKYCWAMVFTFTPS